MDIKRAKAEIKDAIESYLQKDRYGEYCIPIESQRPILLIGPPGIGKTAIMRQVATECGIALVSYTITHHTRQSAIGLPFIEHKVYGGKEYAVTEYTMSEIVAAVYEQMEETGLSEGILFIDEINCASETLAPAMLQFLQYKTFGSHQIPEGWMIVAAGNPPQYNKSVREFDIVTLDRVKKIEVTEDYGVWREYAVEQQVHDAILSFLDLKPESFYTVKNTAEGKVFVTARGWEDLSKLLYVYEALGKKADRFVVGQYFQQEKTAKDFAAYLELYYKYQADYAIGDILQGHWTEQQVDRLRLASFDERMGVICLLFDGLNQKFRACYESDLYLTDLMERLKEAKERLLSSSKRGEEVLQAFLEEERQQYLQKKKAKLWKKEEDHRLQAVLETMEGYVQEVKKEGIADGEGVFTLIKGLFAKEVDEAEAAKETTSAALEMAFTFLETVFREGQELVFFVTRLNSGFYSIWFINENGSTAFYRHNQNLLYKQQQRTILKEMDEIRTLLQSKED